jgi:ribosomal protein S18 acetylase RimI-like enzyme
MPVVYRPAREQELDRAQELVVRSINDLSERHGFGRMASLRSARFQSYSLEDDPDGLWVAEDAGQVVGFAFSWICGKLWFLSELFVAPDCQGRGIGNELLQRTLAHARKRGATERALITFTFNTVSQGLYLRHGLFPRLPVYFVKAARESLVDRLEQAPTRHTPIEKTALHLQILAQVDARVLGTSREKHHTYLVDDGATDGFLLHTGDDCVGYAYVTREGHVGPMAVTRRDAVVPAFKTALSLALGGGAAHVSAFLPGTSEALAASIALGMRITYPMVLMAERDFGEWPLYLPRNPGFM